MPRLPAADLDQILHQGRDLWPLLRGSRLFVTGGTGFFGRWLLESFTHVNDHLQLGTQAVVLSRRPEAFAAQAPHLAEHPALTLWSGDVRTFAFPAGRFDYVIHAATDVSVKLHQEQPLAMLDTAVAGTRRVLDFARVAGARGLLFTSSGAVYGRQPADLPELPEDYHGADDPTDPYAVYSAGKRLAETLGAIYHRSYGLNVRIARCFAFVGPHLPLDTHFAVGNFLRDGLAGGPLRILGDGAPYRSYLYAGDLALWLWTILLRGQSARPYNVGSDRALTIRQLAQTVAERFTPRPMVDVAKATVPGAPAERYVPAINRARTELHLDVRVELPDALERTLRWLRG